MPTHHSAESLILRNYFQKNNYRKIANEVQSSLTTNPKLLAQLAKKFKRLASKPDKRIQLLQIFSLSIQLVPELTELKKLSSFFYICYCLIKHSKELPKIETYLFSSDADEGKAILRALSELFLRMKTDKGIVAIDFFPPPSYAINESGILETLCHSSTLNFIPSSYLKEKFKQIAAGRKFSEKQLTSIHNILLILSLNRTEFKTKNNSFMLNYISGNDSKTLFEIFAEHAPHLESLDDAILTIETWIFKNPDSDIITINVQLIKLLLISLQADLSKKRALFQQFSSVSTFEKRDIDNLLNALTVINTPYSNLMLGYLYLNYYVDHRSAKSYLKEVPPSSGRYYRNAAALLVLSLIMERDVPQLVSVYPEADKDETETILATLNGRMNLHEQNNLVTDLRCAVWADASLLPRMRMSLFFTKLGIHTTQQPRLTNLIEDQKEEQRPKPSFQ